MPASIGFCSLVKKQEAAKFSTLLSPVSHTYLFQPVVQGGNVSLFHGNCSLRMLKGVQCYTDLRFRVKVRDIVKHILSLGGYCILRLGRDYRWCSAAKGNVSFIMLEGLLAPEVIAAIALFIYQSRNS